MSEPYWIVEHPNPWDAQGISEDEWCARTCNPAAMTGGGACQAMGHPPYAEQDGRTSCYCGVTDTGPIP